MVKPGNCGLVKPGNCGKPETKLTAIDVVPVVCEAVKVTVVAPVAVVDEGVVVDFFKSNE